MTFEPQHDPGEVLRTPFDYRRHNETFLRYCEVVVLADGAIEYAVPSHQEKLKALCREMGIDPDAECPEEFFFDYWTWLERQTGAILVWHDRWHGEPNEAQVRALRRLQMHGCCDFPKLP